MAGMSDDGYAKSVAERLLDLEARVAQLEAQAAGGNAPTEEAGGVAAVRRPRKKGEEKAEAGEEGAVE